MKAAAIIGVLLAAFAFAYAALPRAGFVYEDARWNEAHSAETPAPPLVGSRSLMNWSWWLQARAGQPAWAFHAANVGLHLAATALLWVLVRRLGAPPSIATVAAAVFLLNAVQVEPVAYVSGRTELFAAVGVLAACLLAIGPWSIGRAVAVVAALAFALMGKESALIGLALIPLVRRQWGLALVILAIVLVIVAAVLYQREYLGSPAWMLVQAGAIARVFMWALVPIGLTVDPPVIVALGVGVVCLLAILAVGWAGWRVRARAPLMAIGAIWLVGAALPRLLAWTPASVFNAHQAYLPMAGFSVLVAGWVGAPRMRLHVS